MRQLRLRARVVLALCAFTVCTVGVAADVTLDVLTYNVFNFHAHSWHENGATPFYSQDDRAPGQYYMTVMAITIQ